MQPSGYNLGTEFVYGNFVNHNERYPEVSILNISVLIVKIYLLIICCTPASGRKTCIHREIGIIARDFISDNRTFCDCVRLCAQVCKHFIRNCSFRVVKIVQFIRIILSANY